MSVMRFRELKMKTQSMLGRPSPNPSLEGRGIRSTVPRPGQLSGARCLLILLPLALATVTACQTPPSQATSDGPSSADQTTVAPTGDETASTHDRAIEQIITSSRSDDPFLRANAIESAHDLPERVVQFVHLGMRDESPVVRFVAVATVGKLKLADLMGSVEKLHDDVSPSVRAAVLFALRCCGRPVDLSPLADMFVQPDPTLRGNVALLLGELGEPSAIDMLKILSKAPLDRTLIVEQEEIVRIQIAEAMVLLGDDLALEVLRASAYSPYDEVRIIAVRALGSVVDRKFERGLINLLDQNPIELKLAAAESLALITQPHDPNRARVEKEVLLRAMTGARWDAPAVRAQAALVLSTLNSPAAAAWRARLLDDSHEQVRLAAAAAIIRAADEHEGR